jgi:hypothetical protein
MLHADAEKLKYHLVGNAERKRHFQNVGGRILLKAITTEVDIM